MVDLQEKNAIKKTIQKSRSKQKLELKSPKSERVIND